MLTTDDYSIQYQDLLDDVFKGQENQSYRLENGDHLLYVRLRNIKRQQHQFDIFCKDYYRKHKGDINPITMKNLAVNHVLKTCGCNHFVKHHLIH